MIKRILSFVLTIILLCAFCFNSIDASASTSGVIGQCSWKLEGTVLTISGNGEMGNVGNLPWPTTITKVIVEEGVTEIGAHAFYQCSYLTEVVLPESLKTIASSSFNWCDRLTNIYIPKNVSYIDEWAFDYCGSLHRIDVDASNAYYTSQDGILFNKNKTIIVRYPSAKLGTFYEIPSTITEIANNAFEGCYGLNGFSVPNNISRIGYNAFSYTGYSNNKSNYDNGVLYLGPYVIGVDWDKKVNDCVLRDGTKLIANGSFGAWETLKTLVFPDGFTTIGDNSLAFCSSLESIRLPQSLKYIGEGAFSDKNTLAHVYYAGDINSKNSITFGGYNSHIQNQAFWHYDACQYIGLHDWNVTSRIDSTCANEGKEQKTCNKCKKNTTVTIEKKQHNFNKWQKTQEPTCNMVGVQERQCLQCGYTEKENIKILDSHNFGGWTDEKVATCMEEGTQKRKCKTCGKSETKTINALEHNVKKYAEKKVDSSGTVVLEGTCDRCGEVITKTLSNVEVNKKTDEQQVEPIVEEDSSNTAKTSFVQWKLIICVVGGSIVVLAVVVTVIVLLKKKKKNK